MESKFNIKNFEVEEGMSREVEEFEGEGGTSQSVRSVRRTASCVRRSGRVKRVRTLRRVPLRPRRCERSLMRAR